ncbi:MAG: DUF4349 domain-containing protein [Clostridiales bacterium]|nr:DUF4349 domain-containing protein [Clostridiales bacterium]
MKRIKKTATAIVAALAVFSLAACGAASGSAYDSGNYAYAPAEAYYDEDYEADYYSEKPAYAAETAAAGAVSFSQGDIPMNTDPNRKIVYTVDIQLETKEFDDTVAQIYAVTEKLGGYIESSYVRGGSLYNSDSYSYRSASYTLRVPSSSLNEAVDGLSASGNVVSMNRNSNDITNSYYDVEARLKSLREEEERLNEMLNGADELQYMIQIEDKLSEIRYQIENYYSSLQRMDSSVNYSTVNVSLEEVHNLSVVKAPISFGDRIRSAFVDSWAGFAEGVKDFCVWFVEAFPTLLVWAVVIVIIVIIVRAIIRHNRKKRLKRAMAAPAMPPVQPAQPAQPTQNAPPQNTPDDASGKK